ncbi:MAG: hypothetical protein ACXVYW_18455 [Oryzihumus sp.]
MKATEFARRADAVISGASQESVREDSGDLPLLRGERVAARGLTRVLVTVALLVVVGAAACALLAPFGLWLPLLVLPLLLVLAVVCARVSRLASSPTMPVWAVAAIVVLALGTTVWAGLTHSEQALPRRDPGSYLQSATALATTHRLPVQVPADTVGGAAVLRIPGVTLESPAFYQVGTATDPAVQPQFMVGTAAWYSVGIWLAGPLGAIWLAAVFGGLGVLGLGLLTGSVVGPRWGPLGALASAICFPMLHINRSTYSEPLAVVVLVAGLLVLVECTRKGARGHWQHARQLGFLAGLLVAGGGLMRVDALRETLLLLPFAALLIIRRDGGGWPLLAGAGIGTLVSFAAGLGLSDQYLGSIAGSLLPLVALGVGLALLATAVVVAARRGVRLPDGIRRLLPAACAIAVLVIGVVLAARPLFQTVHQSAADPGSHVVAGLQHRQGLVVDGARTYAEQSLAWTAWWLGPAALVIAFALLAGAAHRVARAWVAGEPLPRWSGPFLVAFASAVLTWYRPGITPDHPWADRRLMVALPLVIIAVVAAAAWLTRWSTRHLPPAALVASSVVVSAALLVPEAMATWPHATERVEHGELAAVDQVCRAFAPGDVALTVDDRAALEWPQVVRGQCGVPSLSLTQPVRRDPAARGQAVAAVAQAVRANGGRLVLLAADSDAALRTPLPAGVTAGPVVQATDVMVREDARLLERRPDHLVSLPIRVWLVSVR